MSVFNVAPGEAATYIANTTARTGEWKAITVLENTTFSILTANNWEGSTDGLVVGAGVTLFGSFTKIQLSAGRVVAYRA